MVLTLTDQVVSSASNFVLSAMVARLGGVSALGAFGVALLVWLAVVGINRALVSEPMTVTGGPEIGVREQREGIAASALVGLAIAALLAAGCLMAAEGGLSVAGMLALAPWLPSLLMQDYCRAAAFRIRRPQVALASDVAFAVVQVGCTVALAYAGYIGVGAFLAAWGIGATTGAVVGMGMLRVAPAGLHAGWSRLRRLWPRSRWFLAEFGTAFPGDQGYLFLLPALLGTAPFGLYRAASGLIGPIVVIFLAAGNVGLPEAVRSLREGGAPGLRRFTIRLTAAVVGVTVLYCGAIAVLAAPLLRLVYGAPFAPAATITAFVACQYVLYSLSFGAGVAMKAAGRMKALWVVRAATATLTITCAAVLASVAGLTGAGIAALVAGAVYSAGVIIAYRIARPGTPAPRRRGGAHRLAKGAPSGAGLNAFRAVQQPDHTRRYSGNHRVGRNI